MHMYVSITYNQLKYDRSVRVKQWWSVTNGSNILTLYAMHMKFLYVPTASYIQCTKFQVLQRFVDNTSTEQSVTFLGLQAHLNLGTW